MEIVAVDKVLADVRGRGKTGQNVMLIYQSMDLRVIWSFGQCILQVREATCVLLRSVGPTDGDGEKEVKTEEVTNSI